MLKKRQIAHVLAYLLLSAGVLLAWHNSAHALQYTALEQSGNYSHNSSLQHIDCNLCLSAHGLLVGIPLSFSDLFSAFSAHHYSVWFLFAVCLATRYRTKARAPPVSLIS